MSSKELNVVLVGQNWLESIPCNVRDMIRPQFQRIYTTEHRCNLSAVMLEYLQSDVLSVGWLCRLGNHRVERLVF